MKTLLSFAVLGVLALVGCDRSDQKSAKDVTPKTTDLGTGLNAVERTYSVPASEMAELASSTLQSLGLTVESNTHDNLGGEIVARRADGHKVTAKITARDEAQCDVSIRVAPGNRPLAEQIHDRMGPNAGERPAK